MGRPSTCTLACGSPDDQFVGCRIRLDDLLAAFDGSRIQHAFFQPWCTSIRSFAGSGAACVAWMVAVGFPARPARRHGAVFAAATCRSCGGVAAQEPFREVVDCERRSAQCHAVARNRFHAMPLWSWHDHAVSRRYRLAFASLALKTFCFPVLGFVGGESTGQWRWHVRHMPSRAINARTRSRPLAHPASAPFPLRSVPAGVPRPVPAPSPSTAARRWPCHRVRSDPAFRCAGVPARR